MTARDDEELAALLSDLETTLRDLRDELDENGRRRTRRDTDESAVGDSRTDSPDTRRRSGDRSPQFDPPSVADILQFTEEYTLPTLIATLEATIEALELFRRILGVATPGDTDQRVGRNRQERQRRSVLDTALSEAGTQASDQFADRLADLRTALSETDLPADDDARSIIADARELTDEIEARVRDADDARSANRRDSSRASDDDRARSDAAARRDSSNTGPNRSPSGGSDDGPVTIEVGGPDDGNESGDGPDTDGSSGEDGDADNHGDGTDRDDTEGHDASDQNDSDDPPEVDVDAELESIKREMGDAETSDSGGVDTDENTDDSATDSADDE